MYVTLFLNIVKECRRRDKDALFDEFSQLFCRCVTLVFGNDSTASGNRTKITDIMRQHLANNKFFALSSRAAIIRWYNVFVPVRKWPFTSDQQISVINKRITQSISIEKIKSILVKHSSDFIFIKCSNTHSFEFSNHLIYYEDAISIQYVKVATWNLNVRWIIQPLFDLRS